MVSVFEKNKTVFLSSKKGNFSLKCEIRKGVFLSRCWDIQPSAAGIPGQWTADIPGQWTAGQ